VPTLSVVVPTLDEAAFLPQLLDALAAQTCPPGEVVVADAGSTDDTVALALAHGARVVAGGTPAAGRNAGAAAADGELLLFLDADVRPGPDFVRRAVEEFVARGLDAATAPVVPLERAWDLRLAYVLTEAYLRALVRVRPHAVGACLLVRRGLHDRLGGFDETIGMGEDHDYARRASRAGRYGVLRAVKIPTSMRRVARLGRLRYARLTLASELRTLAGRPPRRPLAGYELGGGRRVGSGARVARRLARWRRILARPSTGLQGDAIALVAAGAATAVAAAVVAGVFRTRWAPAVAAASGVVAGASAAVALRTVRHERPYGRFFTATVATADRDVRDASGRLLARAGEDDVCEFHAVRNLAKLADLRRAGPAGRLAARVEIIEGIAALADSFGDPRYAGVTALVARSDIALALRRLGFAEVDAPPFDLPNRVEKWLLARRIRGSKARGGVRPDTLVVLSRSDWERPATRAALDAWLAQTRADLARAEGALRPPSR